MSDDIAEDLVCPMSFGLAGFLAYVWKRERVS